MCYRDHSAEDSDKPVFEPELLGIDVNGYYSRPEIEQFGRIRYHKSGPPRKKALIPDQHHRYRKHDS